MHAAQSGILCGADMRYVGHCIWALGIGKIDASS